MYLLQMWTTNRHIPNNLKNRYVFDFRDFDSMDTWKEMNTTILEG